MLRRTRVSSTMDVGRLSQAVSRPGIDPRIWSSLAFVKAVNVDPDHGPLVDVQMMPTGGLGTARLATEYSGPGFGLYAPIAVDDEVLVEAPSGDPAEGLVVVRRLWSASDPPPQEAIDTPDDVALVVQGGRDLRVHTSGGGEILVSVDDGADLTATVDGSVSVTAGSDVTVDAGGSASVTSRSSSISVSAGTTLGMSATVDASIVAPSIELGSPAVDAVIKGTTYTTAEAVFLTALATYAAAIQSIADPGPPPGPATGPLLTAIATFIAALPLSLSTKVRVG